MKSFVKAMQNIFFEEKEQQKLFVYIALFDAIKSKDKTIINRIDSLLDMLEDKSIDKEMYKSMFYKIDNIPTTCYTDKIINEAKDNMFNINCLKESIDKNDFIENEILDINYTEINNEYNKMNISNIMTGINEFYNIIYKCINDKEFYKKICWLYKSIPVLITINNIDEKDSEIVILNNRIIDNISAVLKINTKYDINKDTFSNTQNFIIELSDNIINGNYDLKHLYDIFLTEEDLKTIDYTYNKLINFKNINRKINSIDYINYLTEDSQYDIDTLLYKDDNMSIEEIVLKYTITNMYSLYAFKKFHYIFESDKSYGENILNIISNINSNRYIPTEVLPTAFLSSIIAISSIKTYFVKNKI